MIRFGGIFFRRHVNQIHIILRHLGGIQDQFIDSIYLDRKCVKGFPGHSPEPETDIFHMVDILQIAGQHLEFLQIADLQRVFPDLVLQLFFFRVQFCQAFRRRFYICFRAVRRIGRLPKIPKIQRNTHAFQQPCGCGKQLLPRIVPAKGHQSLSGNLRGFDRMKPMIDQTGTNHLVNDRRRPVNGKHSQRHN